MTKTSFHIHSGDITAMEVVAIVNAANVSLLGGGGVDGAIHAAAGNGLYEECLALGGCSVGEAKITGGHLLKSKFVIHTVGPVWENGIKNEIELLTACYNNSLRIASEKKITSIAFPNISTGVYRFPKDLAARVAIRTVKFYLKTKPHQISDLYFVCFDDENRKIYHELINSIEV